MELLGFLTVIGLVHVPEIEDYWKTCWISEIGFFGRVMPRDQFEQIFWMLHVSHSSIPAQPKKIDKVKTFLSQSSSQATIPVGTLQ